MNNAAILDKRHLSKNLNALRFKKHLNLKNDNSISNNENEPSKYIKIIFNINLIVQILFKEENLVILKIN